MSLLRILGGFAAVLAALAFFGMVTPSLAASPVVFAAASLTDVLQKTADAYHQSSGRTVVLSFAASSALARQIEASSGADLFISADSDWMDYLDHRGLIAHATRTNLLGNHLVLIAPASSRVKLAIAPHFDLAGALARGRLALADPDVVPAGRYARQALARLGVWNAVADKLVSAENVRVALAYVARGEAPLGIVYATDAASERKVRTLGMFPDNTHQPIIYPAALTKEARPEAKAFLDFLKGPRARAIFEAEGFVVLGK